MKLIELHILQSFPVSCLNRDDVGAPKTAVFGGVNRARISSQCLKRAIREHAKEELPAARFGGTRSRLIIDPLKQALLAEGLADDEATKLAMAIADQLSGLDEKTVGKDGQPKEGKAPRVSTLIFLSPAEIKALAKETAALAKKDPKAKLEWIGEDGMRFYAFGLAPNHDNDMPRYHAAAWADKKRRTEIARRMFRMRFPDVDVSARTIKELRGMEGLRVRALYAELGFKCGVTWKGRNYDRSNWEMADNINQALSVANASLYALTAAVVCSLGYLPSLGFVHDAGTLPFIYDVADLYKHLTSIPAAFGAIRQKPDDDGELTRQLLKQRVEEEKLLQCSSARIARKSASFNSKIHLKGKRQKEEGRGRSRVNS